MSVIIMTHNYVMERVQEPCEEQFKKKVCDFVSTASCESVTVEGRGGCHSGSERQRRRRDIMPVFMEFRSGCAALPLNTYSDMSCSVLTQI